MTLRTVNDRVVSQTTGLEYDGIADKLLDRPAQSTRNAWIVAFREEGYPEKGIRVFWQAYDACPEVCDTSLLSRASAEVSGAFRAPLNDERYQHGVGKANQACFPDRFESERERAKKALSEELSHGLDALRYAVLCGNSTASPKSVVKIAV